MALDDESEPEPDVAVGAGKPRDHRAQLRDYWIVNLVERVLEVYRDPVPSVDAPYGRRLSALLHLVPTGPSHRWLPRRHAYPSPISYPGPRFP